MANAYFSFVKPITVDTVSGCLVGMRKFLGEHNGFHTNGQPNFMWNKFILSIASGGGDIVAGFALFNEMAGMDVTIETHNSGAVDSAALIPFLAGSRRTASRYSGFLFHQISWTFTATSQTRTQISDVTGWLQNYDRMMAELIAERTNLSFDDAQRMMKDGTNLTPQQALDCGVIHAIEEHTTSRDAVNWQI